MATVSVTSRLLYYEVKREEIKLLIEAARTLFSKSIEISVKGTFTDKNGEIVSLKSPCKVDLNILDKSPLKKYIPVIIDGKTEQLVIPELTDELLIQSMA